MATVHQVLQDDVAHSRQLLLRLWHLFLCVLDEKQLQRLLDSDIAMIQARVRRQRLTIHQRQLDRCSDEELRRMAKREKRRLALIQKHFPEQYRPEPLEVRAERKLLQFGANAIRVFVFQDGQIIGYDYRQKNVLVKEIAQFIRQGGVRGRTRGEILAQFPMLNAKQVDLLLQREFAYNPILRRRRAVCVGIRQKGPHDMRHARWVAVEHLQQEEEDEDAGVS